MSVTAAQRLACALVSRSARERASIAKSARVGAEKLARAVAGRPINPNDYLKLCAALGINSMTGEPAPVRQLGDIDWGLLGCGFKLTRRLRGLTTVRKAAKHIGDHASPATLCRLENIKPISINGVIAVCQFIGTQPEQYCGEPKMLHVKRISETRQGRAA